MNQAYVEPALPKNPRLPTQDGEAPLSFDPGDSSKRLQPQSWNHYAYALNNPIRYNDPDGRNERDGVAAGVVVNKSSQVIWVAGDVDGETRVIPLDPGESSAEYLGDADAIVIDPGAAGETGQVIEGESAGAFKIGISEVEIVGDSPTELALERSLGYALSYILGRAGFLSAQEAQRERWVIPRDKEKAEKTKREMQRKLQEKMKDISSKRN